MKLVPEGWRRSLPLLVAVVVPQSIHAQIRPLDNATQCVTHVEIQPELAIRYCKAALRGANRLPTDTVAALYYDLARAYVEENDYGHALTSVDRSVSAEPGVGMSLALRGFIHEHERSYDLAIPDFEAAARADSTLSGPCIGLSKAYEGEGEYDRALTQAARCIRRQPESQAGYWQRALVHEDEMEYRAAARDIATAIRLGPTEYAVYDTQADIYQHLGEWKKAYDDYQKALSFAPLQGVIYADRGSAEWSQGNTRGALADATTAMRLDPTVPRSAELIALLDFYRGDYRSAQSYMREAVTLDPRSAYAVLWLHIIRTRAGVDDRDEFTGDVDSLDLERWPGPVIRYYLGTLAGDQLLAPSASADSADHAIRRCDVDFYLGEGALMKGDSAKAMSLLRGALDRCPVPSTEYAGAREELKLFAAGGQARR